MYVPKIGRAINNECSLTVSTVESMTRTCTFSITTHHKIGKDIEGNRMQHSISISRHCAHVNYFRIRPPQQLPRYRGTSKFYC